MKKHENMAEHEFLGVFGVEIINERAEQKFEMRCEHSLKLIPIRKSI